MTDKAKAKADAKGKTKKTAAKGARRRRSDPMKDVIAATMALAAQTPWRDITLSAIAGAAGISLAELRELVSCKGDILREMARRTDEALLDSIAREPLDGDAADRLFEAIMRRLEIMAPWKAAIRNILDDPAPAACECPPVLGRYFLTQKWMLAAAGLEKSGPEGMARSMGLGVIYLRALRAWVEDEDPGLSHTMARLDQDIRRAVRLERRAQGPLKMARSALRMCRAMARAGARAAGRRARAAGEEAEGAQARS